MEPEWLLCNNCFIHMRDSKSPFSIVSCGHLFCRKCSSEVGDKCSVCNTNGIQSVCLTKPFAPMVAPMFNDILAMAEKLVFAAKFQKFQLEILMFREDQLSKKYCSLKSTYWKINSELNQVKQEYNSVKIAYNELMVQNKRSSVLIKETPKYARVRFAEKNTIFGHNQPDPRNRFCPVSGNISEDSDASGFGDRRSRTPRMVDGIFRVPGVPAIPRSAGSSTTSSRISTPSCVNYGAQSSGYESNTSTHFRR
ncbi:RING finger protein 212B-like [Fopius arisanus]|uniref:RING finger protein 212B-like n=1 Tax=Fopius arisanus TaxID=64838 RepID=A0A9R1SYL5_9HYME|nr:PREDICTED: RING finger protein 212B-like [Fopius arisanus]